MILPSYFIISNTVSQNGYDVFPYKIGKKYVVLVWKDNEFLKQGVVKYKNWKEAVRQTNIIIYKSLTDKS